MAWPSDIYSLPLPPEVWRARSDADGLVAPLFRNGRISETGEGYRLVEAIASQLLVERGWPISDFLDAIEIVPDGWTAADICAAFASGDTAKIMEQIEREFPLEAGK